MLVYRRLRAASGGCDDVPCRRRNPAGTPWSPFGDQFVPYPCLRGQRERLGGGEGEGEHFASFGSCVFAPDLRGESTSACSIRPICPVETSHPHCQSSLSQYSISSKFDSALALPLLVPVFDRPPKVSIHIAFGDGVSLVIKALSSR